MASQVTWDGAERVRNNIGLYGEQCRRAVRSVADYYAPIIEAHAKTYAPWEDQTGNARQGLHAFVEELSTDVVALYLSHGVEYGRWLELKYQGRYAIILPTLQAHYGPIATMLKGIFE